MGKKADKGKSGYYEIRRGGSDKSNLPISIITGNVIYNALHWHDHAELIYCVEGAFRVRVEEQVFPMAAGDILLINGQDSHEIFDGVRDGLQIIASIDGESLRSPNARYHCQTVGDRALERENGQVKELRKLLGRLAYYTTPSLPEDGLSEYDFVKRMEVWKRREIAQAMYHGLLDSDGEWYGYLACCYRLLQILSEFQMPERRPDRREKNEDFRRCISYIHEHYQEELSIRRLAGVMNVSEPGLYRIFQNKLSVTPTTYIHIVRIRMACAMLKNPARKVADIAFECGFSSLSNFYRTFEKQMKISPREYRKQASASAAQPETFFRGESSGNLQSVMDANIFQNIFELPYDKDVFLALSEENNDI